MVASFYSGSARTPATPLLRCKVFQSPIFDIVVALPFLFAVLSLACTAIHEWVVALLRLRAKTLKSSLGGLLDDATVQLSDLFYAHTEMRAVTRSAQGHPSYLCPKTFARVLVDVLTGTETALVEAGHILAAIQALPPGPLRATLLNLLRHVNVADPEAVVHIHQRLESWFNGAMERTGAAYQRHAQVITCLIALAVSIAVNADSLHVAQRLWSSPAVRAHLLAEAEKAAASHPSPAASRIQVEEQLGSLLSWTDDVRESGCDLTCPSGWFSFALWCVPRRLAGWLLTTVAISLGAPFWFDTLNRFVRLRLAEPRPDPAGGR